MAFLNVVGEALHVAGKVFGVFLYPSMDKAKYINGLASVDHWLGTLTLDYNAKVPFWHRRR